MCNFPLKLSQIREQKRNSLIGGMDLQYLLCVGGYHKLGSAQVEYDCGMCIRLETK